MKFSATLALGGAIIAMVTASDSAMSRRDLSREGILGARDGLMGRGQQAGAQQGQGEQAASAALAGLSQISDSVKQQLASLGMSGFSITETQVTNVVLLWVNQGGGAQTIYAQPEMAAAARGAVHEIAVGGPAGLVYFPQEIQANIGDTVLFTFYQQNHTATQSTFSTPCDRMQGGMDTGFRPNPNNTMNPPPQVAMQVMVNTPIWFYCRQTNHCGKGMVFSVNPTAEQTQAMFAANAIAQKGNGASSPITDGNNTAPPPPMGTSGVAPHLPPPAQASPPPAAGGAGNIVSGQGTLDANGACVCAALCGAGSFPAEAQGIGAFGGFAGSLPMKMAVAV